MLFMKVRNVNNFLFEFGSPLVILQNTFVFWGVKCFPKLKNDEKISKRE